MGLSIWVEKELFGLRGWGCRKIHGQGYLEVKE